VKTNRADLDCDVARRDAVHSNMDKEHLAGRSLLCQLRRKSCSS